MRGLHPYPEYKHSEVPWLGEVPEHWLVERGKCLYREMARPVQESDEVVTCFRDGMVTLRSRRRTLGFTNSLKEIGYQGVRRGDLVLHAMDAFAGAVGVSDSDGKCTPVYAVCEAKRDLENRYYAYVVREMARSQWIAALARGIRERSTDFRFADFGDQSLPVPNRNEQSAIVSFLDGITSRVNRFIRNRRRLIALLNEQKQAIIDQAVTRGLDPNVRLKPSGVEWLGEIAEYSQVTSLRYLATKFCSGVTPRGGAAVYESDGVPFLRSQNVRFEGLRLENVARISPDLHAALSATHVMPQDILLNITGASIGRVCAVPSGLVEANVNQHVCIIRPRQRHVCPDYLGMYLASSPIQHEIYVQQNGASREGLASDAIRALPIVLPPLDLQRQIVERLGEQTGNLVRLLHHTERQIDLIREYRTRLISDVVTGKVDVRGLAEGLEYEPIEPEDLSDDIDSGDMPEDDELALVQGAADADE